MYIDYIFADSLDDAKRVATWATIILEITTGAYIAFKDGETLVAWQKNDLNKIPKNG